MTHILMLDLKCEYEYMKQEIDSAISRCLDHQRWILGPEVKEFEDKAAEYIGVRHCIGTSSGTDALVLALRALAIKIKGEEHFDRSDLIITTPFTFTATGDAILRAGATPLFVDIDSVTYNINPAKIREASHLHSSRVVGVLPVHLYGQSCQMDEIMAVAEEYGLFVVEDVAQAFGGEWQEASGERRKLGSIGTAGCFSFFPSKNLGGFGDGGIVSTNDDKLNDLIRMLLKHGGKDKYNVDHIGYNSRLDTIQAAVLLAKLPYIDEFNSRRRHIAQVYVEGLLNVPGIVLPSALGYSPLALSSHVFHQFTIRVLEGRRDALQQHLRERGVESMVYYPVPLHKMKVFGGRYKGYGELSETELAVQQVLSLPIEPLYRDDHIFHITKGIREFCA